jgi:hypothetical protein
VPYIIGPQPGGFFFVLIENHDDTDAAGQIFRYVDLAGTTVWETNAARINEQLTALGHQPMTSFHHDAKLLPNGNVLVLAANERILRDVQGDGDVAVIGDMILELNEDLEIQWVWDAFDHMDVTRKAVLDEKCTPGAGGCPVFRLAPVANDWLHGNSISVAPDGNILYSARHMDWIVKIHYAGGLGTGEVIWRLGKDGDFELVSDDPEPWFSHQHDAKIVTTGESNHLLLFDNGNTRRAVNSSVRSRGQLWAVHEPTRTARLILNADLLEYALAVGSADRLENGNYHFGIGWSSAQPIRSQSLEFDSSGRLVTQVEMRTQVYRSVRVRDLYTPNQQTW